MIKIKILNYRRSKIHNKDYNRHSSKLMEQVQEQWNLLASNTESYSPSVQNIRIHCNFGRFFNYVNYNTFIGNQLSPFYGEATSAGPARRIELGVSIGF